MKNTRITLIPRNRLKVPRLMARPVTSLTTNPKATAVPKLLKRAEELRTQTSPKISIPNQQSDGQVTVKIKFPIAYGKSKLVVTKEETKVATNEMIQLGANLTQTKLLNSTIFLADEIAVRLTGRFTELESLPFGLADSDAVKEVKGWYTQSIKELKEFGEELRVLCSKTQDSRWLGILESKNAGYALPRQFKYLGDCQNSAILASSAKKMNIKFAKILHRIIERHNPVVLVLAKALDDFRKSNPHIKITDPIVQAFLDKFHRARIGIRLLIGHHLSLNSQLNSRKHKLPNYVGIFCTNTSIEEVAEEAVAAASDVCENTYGVSPKVDIRIEKQVDGDGGFTHIPSHLHYILFELLKNAMRAVVEKEIARDSKERKVNDAEREKNSETGTGFWGSFWSTPGSQFIKAENLEDIVIDVTITEENVLLKISDKGTGISPREMNRIFLYSYSSVPGRKYILEGSMNQPMTSMTLPLNESLGQIENEEHGKGVPMAGFGYGLPLSRLYARYFGGDLWTESRVGEGTDAHLTIRRDLHRNIIKI